ncbi:MAG: cbb3-type cytochrome oxidase assembly protein CcoS [Dinoroseobacter sp.]|nr:cbb3-type cytochrome oxidase assembly protein CcoS [Dinoroseobacter sp.]
MRMPSYLTADLLGLGIISLAAFFKALKSRQYYDSGSDVNRILTVDSDDMPVS